MLKKGICSAKSEMERIFLRHFAESSDLYRLALARTRLGISYGCFEWHNLHSSDAFDGILPGDADHADSKNSFEAISSRVH